MASVRSLKLDQAIDLPREAAITALRRVIEPLMDLMMDTGITVQEFAVLAKEQSVRTAAVRILRESGRVNKSQVAIVTGLARSQVANVLKTDRARTEVPTKQHPARKVLAGWYDNPRFLDSLGEPAVLPVFGKKQSFERLVASYSGGTPVRAMLDQLTNIDAVEILSNQRVRAKSRVPIFRGLTADAITAIGERAGDLLTTMLKNVTCVDPPLFEGTVIIDDVDPDATPFIRREITEQATSFINGANSLLSRSRRSLKRTPLDPLGQCRAGVTVFYFQSDENPSSLLRNKDASRRKNLSRKRAPKTKSTTQTRHQ